MEFFQECYKYFDETTKAQVSTSQTAEWLLDNFYVIEQAIRQIEEDLPADYYQRLPKTQAGWPRIYLVALANTSGEETRLDLEADQKLPANLSGGDATHHRGTLGIAVDAATGCAGISGGGAGSDNQAQSGIPVPSRVPCR